MDNKLVHAGEVVLATGVVASIAEASAELPDLGLGIWTPIATAVVGVALTWAKRWKAGLPQ